MILSQGSKLLVSHRRLFDLHHARFFTGVVDGYEGGIVRLRGHTWIRDACLGEFMRKDDERTKIISIASGAVIVYLLPDDVYMPSLRLCNEGTSVLLRDVRGFGMDLTEGVLHGTTPTAGEARPRRSA